MQKIRKVFAKVVAGLLVVSNLAIAAPSMTYAASATSFTTYGGWNEMMYATIKGVKDADVTAVSYSGPVSGSLTGEDFEYLVRDTSEGVRVDVMGLKPGTYTLTVTTKSGTYTQSGIEVNEQDRSGYAHYNYTDGVGAYNDDGTLKDNAIVLYVTEENKNTVTLSYDGITVSGIGNILNSAGAKPRTDVKNPDKVLSTVINTNQEIIKKLAENNIPLVVRIVGKVSNITDITDPGSKQTIEGLTAYDSYDCGGTVGDSGSLARMKSGKDITIEGVGDDANVDGWGFHFICESGAPELGKSFEVRNIAFTNVPEDSVGMEGVQTGNEITASVERCWIHNNNFKGANFSLAAESDKKEGDGSVDFKRGQYLTVSYNYFEGAHKTNLVGSSDSSLQFHLTYHHNFWYMCKARGPLTRQANVHMYNNLIMGQTDYAMNTRADAYIFAESNMFYAAKNPMRVDGGAIKSYNNGFSSVIGSNQGTVVTDKSTKVDSNCRYANFDTNSDISYIPSGNYKLQEDLTEARKVIYAYTGVMKANTVTPENVTMSMISVVPNSVTPENISALPYTTIPGNNGKIEKTVYAFTVGGKADVEIAYNSEDLTATGVLVNEAGVPVLIGSGIARNLPAGTYMIQPYNLQAGSQVPLTQWTFKTATVTKFNVTAADLNAHYHNYVSEVTKEATCTEEGQITYTCTATNGTCDKKTYTEVIPKKAHTYGDWVIEKEATETETGLKRHTCTVCGADETDIIPVKGSEPDVPVVEGDYVQNFTKSGMTSSFYTITGSTSDTKGSVTYNGLTLTKCLKMESKTNIAFTAPSAGKLTLVFGGTAAASGKTVNVNGTAATVGTDGIVTVDVAAGNVTVTKGDSINLFYMVYTPEKTEVTHKHNYVSKVTREATCTEDGELTYTCTSTTGTCDAPSYTEVIKATGHKFSDEWTIDIAPTQTTPGSKSHHCTVCDEKTDVTEIPATGTIEKKNGFLKDADGVWRYYADGEVDTTYTRLARNEWGWFYVNCGVLDRTYSGLADNDWGTWYVKNGALDMSKTGLAKSGTDWVYVKEGRFDTTYTGLADNDWGTWYVKDGVLDRSKTGLVDNGTDLVYVKSGLVDTTTTGLVKSDSSWFYVKDGVLDTTYTGLAKNTWGWFYVKDGALDNTYTGIASNQWGTWYIQNGYLDRSFSGSVVIDGVTYNIESGLVK